MKTKHFLIGGLATLSLIMVSSCTDSSYDLNNVDTTARFKANDLIVPINLAVLTFDQVLDLDENSEIVKDKDASGREIYAVKKEGNFHSDPVKVEKITAHPTINPKESTLDVLPGTPPGFDPQITAYYDINIEPVDFQADANDFDKAIKEIKQLGTESKLYIRLKIKSIGSKTIDFSKVFFEDLKVEYPIGLDLSSEDTGIAFDKANHCFTISKKDIQSNGEAIVELDVNEIDATQRPGEIDYNNRTIKIRDKITVKSGSVNIYGINVSDLPEKVKFTFQPTIDNIVVEKFTGKVQYDVENVNIEPIDLSNLPDFLKQDGTKMGIMNPQIYLAINNPVGDYASFESGFSLTPERDGIKGTPATLDAKVGEDWVPNKDGVMTVKKVGTNDQYYVLSPFPYNKTRDFEEFPNPSHEFPYTGLRFVMDTPTKTSGVNGIPTKIYVETVKPQVPEQEVTKFQLGKEYGKEVDNKQYGVYGKYMLYAPLQLTDNTTINYTDTLDGWNDEDVDKLNITALKLNMTVTTEVSFPIELTIVPTTFNSKPIPGVTANTVTLPAGAVDYPFEVVFHGEIAHLDGLLLKAKVVNGDDQTILGPTMKILMKNSKATLTGYYEKEL